MKSKCLPSLTAGDLTAKMHGFKTMWWKECVRAYIRMCAYSLGSTLGFFVMHLAPGLSVIFTHSSARMSLGLWLALTDKSNICHPSPTTQLFQSSGRHWREKGNVVSMEPWKWISSGILGKPAFVPREGPSLLSSNEAIQLHLTIVFHLIIQLVYIWIWSWYCCLYELSSSFFFAPVLILNVSCQVLMDRHLHSFTDVDVGKDYNTCGRMSVFAHDLYPHGYYRTHTHRQNEHIFPERYCKCENMAFKCM